MASRDISADRESADRESADHATRGDASGDVVGLEIVLMPDRQEFWRQAAAWSLAEWQQAWPHDTAESYRAHYEATVADPTRLPLVLAAVQGERLLGVVTLIDDDELPGATESPWLAACVVDPDARGSGIGRRLVSACEALARDLGYSRLHLFTWSERQWYASMGWHVLRTVRFADHDTDVMVKELI
jgi:GNAT superfamily N-acetyltransferase